MASPSVAGHLPSGAPIFAMVAEPFWLVTPSVTPSRPTGKLRPELAYLRSILLGAGRERCILFGCAPFYPAVKSIFGTALCTLTICGYCTKLGRQLS